MSNSYVLIMHNDKPGLVESIVLWQLLLLIMNTLRNM